MGAHRTPYAPFRETWRRWDCDLAPGAPDKDGYGRVRESGKQVRAHRKAWKDANGDLPSSVLVLHHCDVRKCRRLQHLWIGDDADNMRDRDEKGRGATPPQGLRETASRTKLDTQARLVIIEAIENGAKKELLAVRFGVHPKTIASIWRYRANDGWRK